MAARMAADASIDKYQCMFTWSRGLTHNIDSEWVIKSVEDKLLTSDSEWQSIVYHLVLFYEYQLLGKDFAARDHLVECENIILDSECFAASPLVKRNIVAINHVVYSSWVHFIAKTVPFDDYEDYLSLIKLYKTMNKKQKAGVLAIHAACLMQYCSQGHAAATEFVRLAIRNDEHQGHWHFLLGEILCYKRRSMGDLDSVPTPEELKCFELAHFYDESSPAHYLSYASSLYDCVNKEKGPCEKRDKATQLYKAALENWPNSAYVNLMSASGLLCYAYPVRDTKLADKCLGKALRLAPLSCHVNMVAGAYFKWPNNNPVAANRHFNIAKKRFSSLIDKINQGEISNYRMALWKAITDIPPTPPPTVVTTTRVISSEDFFDFDNIAYAFYLLSLFFNNPQSSRAYLIIE